MDLMLAVAKATLEPEQVSEVFLHWTEELLQGSGCWGVAAGEWLQGSGCWGVAAGEWLLGSGVKPLLPSCATPSSSPAPPVPRPSPPDVSHSVCCPGAILSEWKDRQNRHVGSGRGRLHHVSQC